MDANSETSAVARANIPQSQNDTVSDPSLTTSSRSHLPNTGRSTAENILYSQENIEEMVSKVPEWDTPGIAISHTENYIRKALESIQHDDSNKPIVVLIGEGHISNAATAAEMAAMNVLKEISNGTHAPLLLIENPPANVSQFHEFLNKVEKGQISTPETVSDIYAGTPLKLPYLLAPCSPDREPGRVHHDRTIVKTGMALHVGFEVHGFDKLSVNAENMEQREEAMVSGVHDALGGNAKTALLITGAYHVKALHESLASDVHLITLSETMCYEDMKLRTRKSSNYALTTADIFNFRGSDELEGDVDLSSDAYRLGLLPRPW
ncbi:hypothetical protein [Herbaspirillum sp. CF444]|uniref:hypothetical protein n=1 Tax=Herbaspirillum sp. CF444 TaxID=1144319 RepID=UPI0012FC33A4|nr:hypothetical protein [Herbaspirillum sp. CF444]